MEEALTPTALPVNLKPWMVTVAVELAAVASTSPLIWKPFCVEPEVMTVPPAPEPCPMIVSSLPIVVAPAKVPGPTRIVSPALAALIAAWMVV